MKSLTEIKSLISSLLTSECTNPFDLMEEYTSFDMSLKMIDVLEKDSWLTSEQVDRGRKAINLIKDNGSLVTDEIRTSFMMDFMNLANMSCLGDMFVNPNVAELFELEKDSDGFYEITPSSQLDFFPFYENVYEPFDIKVYDPLAQLIFENQDIFAKFIEERVKNANYYGDDWKD